MLWQWSAPPGPRQRDERTWAAESWRIAPRSRVRCPSGVGSLPGSSFSHARLAPAPPHPRRARVIAYSCSGGSPQRCVAAAAGGSLNVDCGGGSRDSWTVCGNRLSMDCDIAAAGSERKKKKKIEEEQGQQGQRAAAGSERKKSPDAEPDRLGGFAAARDPSQRAEALHPALRHLRNQRQHATWKPSHSAGCSENTCGAAETTHAQHAAAAHGCRSSSNITSSTSSTACMSELEQQQQHTQQQQQQ